MIPPIPHPVALHPWPSPAMHWPAQCRVLAFNASLRILFLLRASTAGHLDKMALNGDSISSPVSTVINACHVLHNTDLNSVNGMNSPFWRHSTVLPMLQLQGLWNHQHIHPKISQLISLFWCAVCTSIRLCNCICREFVLVLWANQCFHILCCHISCSFGCCTEIWWGFDSSYLQQHWDNQFNWFALLLWYHIKYIPLLTLLTVQILEPILDMTFHHKDLYTCTCFYQCMDYAGQHMSQLIYCSCWCL